MIRTTKVMGFSVPPALYKEVQSLAKAERRTKSELFREMVRVYSRYRQLREANEERWINELIRSVEKEEEARPTPQAELLEESERLVREGERQFRKRGLKAKDVNRLLREYRTERS